MGISLQATLTATPPAQGKATQAASEAPDDGHFSDVFAGLRQARSAASDKDNETARSLRTEDARTTGEDAPASPAGPLLPAATDDSGTLAAMLLQAGMTGNAAAPDRAKADTLDTAEADPEGLNDAALAAMLMPASTPPAAPGAASPGAGSPTLATDDALGNPGGHGSDIAAEMAALLEQARQAGKTRSAAHAQHEEGDLPAASRGLSDIFAGHKGRADETANIAATTDTMPTSTPTAFQDALKAANAPRESLAATDIRTRVDTPLGRTGWHQEFGERVVFMSRNEVKSAEIAINPPNMGPVHISLQMNGEQLSATFASPHAEVRQAIEDALPRLREMMSDAGIQLGDANVGSQSARQSFDQTPGKTANPTRFADEPAILAGDISHAGNTTVVKPLQQGRGLVDLFA